MDEKPLLNEITKLVNECEKLASFRSAMTNNLVWIAKKVALYEVEFDISGGRSPNKGSKKTRLDDPIEDPMVRIFLPKKRNQLMKALNNMYTLGQLRSKKFKSDTYAI